MNFFIYVILSYYNTQIYIIIIIIIRFRQCQGNYIYIYLRFVVYKLL